MGFRVSFRRKKKKKKLKREVHKVCKEVFFLYFLDVFKVPLADVFMVELNMINILEIKLLINMIQSFQKALLLQCNSSALLMKNMTFKHSGWWWWGGCLGE